MTLKNQMMFHHQKLFLSHNKNQHQLPKSQLQFHKKEPHKRLYQSHKKNLMMNQNHKSLFRNKHLNNRLLPLNQSQRLQLQLSLLPRNQLIQMRMKNLTFPHHPKEIINNPQRLLNHQKKVKWKLKNQMKMIYHHHQRSRFKLQSQLLHL